MDFYFVRFYRFNYCAFGSPGNIYPSLEKVLEKSWKIVVKKGMNPEANFATSFVPTQEIEVLYMCLQTVILTKDSELVSKRNCGAMSV